MRKIFRQVNLFIAPSKFLKKIFIEAGISSQKIIYSVHGIDIALHKPVYKNSSQLRFGFVSSPLYHKGIYILIDAFNRIKNGSLDIYGRIPDSKKKEYNLLIKNEHIKLKGEVSGEEKRRAFANIDVLVVPSICTENSPIVIHEAFASRIPVIASNIGGIPELVEDGKTGLLCEPGNSDDLFNKINYLTNHPEEAAKMSNQITPPKTIQEQALELESIYLNLVANLKKYLLK